jgi:small subunit ribosomal protein S9
VAARGFQEMKMEQTEFYGTGRRKTSIARVWLRPGDGKITVNSLGIEGYLSRKTLQMIVQQPLEATNTTGRYNVYATVEGGGHTGQAGALRHGIARALLQSDETLKDALRRGGFLTRDPRKKERKKYGLKGARARFQFSKR